MPVSALVEIFGEELDLAAEDAALGSDFFDRQFATDLLVLAELGVSARERIVETDLDRLLAESLHQEWACNLHGAERKTGLEHRSAPHGAANKILGHRFLPWGAVVSLRFTPLNSIKRDLAS